MNVNKKGNSQIKTMRLKNGYTLAELSKIIGVSGATLQRYESGEIQNIKLSTITKLAHALGCSEAYLMGWEAQDEFDIFSFDNIMHIHRQTIPILGDIACGKPILCSDNTYDTFTTDFETKADCCLIAKGDSMIDARIYDGDVVFIKLQCEVENGEIAAVIIDNEATLKRVYVQNDILTLMPANPKYSPLVYTKEEAKNIRILGKAIGMQTKNLL